MKRKNIFYFTFILVGLFIISTLLSFSHHLNIHLIDYSKPKEWGRKIDSVESTPKSSLLIEGDRSCDIVPPFFDDFERYNVGINACWINATSPITETITYNPTDTSIAFRYDTIYRYDTNYVPGQVYQYFNYTGSPQNWTVPAGITTVGLSLWGAQGGGWWTRNLYSGYWREGWLCCWYVVCIARRCFNFYYWSTRGNSSFFPFLS